LFQKPGADLGINLVANFTEFLGFLRITTLKSGRVFERPMQPFSYARKDRAFFFRFAANRDKKAKMHFSQIS